MEEDKIVKCKYCGSYTSEISGKHFCQVINCPLWMQPQEWFVELKCATCNRADRCGSYSLDGGCVVRPKTQPAEEEE